MKATTASGLRTIAITCAYGEEEKLEKVLLKFQDRVVNEICITIDSPTEDDLRRITDTASTMSIPVHIIVNNQKKGVGYGLRRCIEYSLDKGYDIAVAIAGNNKDDPREIPRLLQAIIKEDCDYVQGSRFLPGAKHVRNPFFRGAFSRIYPFLWTLCTNTRCTDVTNGFRAYRLNIFRDKRIDIWQDWLNSYELEYYVHFKALTLGYRTKEVPVSKTYPHRYKGGYSKISPFRDWWKIVRPLIYLKLNLKK